MKTQNKSTKNDPIIQALPAACSNEKAAVEFLESMRWGDHPACPRCGYVDVYQMKNAVTGERQENYRWRCHGCDKQFTVRIGTVFEDSRIPLRHWCFAFWRSSTSKKGVSALEIHHQTGLSYKSCLFMLNRIRFAMDDYDIEPLKGTVEVDEVFVGGKPRRIHKSFRTVVKEKTVVVGMKERGGRIRPRIIPDVTANTLRSVMLENIHPSARVMTDEWRGYHWAKFKFASHETVNHSGWEYARGDVTTNGIEGFFGMLRRGLNGIYHSVSKKHLHRYLAEFEFRHNYRELNDGERTLKAIQGADGKRLTYKASIA